MSPTEQREWLWRLGRTPEQQRRALVELLRYSAQDEMSAADRAICRTALDRLDREAAHV
jgi:thioesterase domain-containing protein